MEGRNIAPHRIFFVGMPGSGKSYWGRKVAAYYDRQFIDLDEYICEREGRTTPELFAAEGELGFRIMENKYLAELVNTTQSNVVIACGGGTPCYADNMRLMKIEGFVVYLEADTAYLYNNLLQDSNIRPLFDKAAPLQEQIAALYLQRKTFYEQAHIILQAKDISVATFGQILGNA
jgi:shikimate kinase